MDEKYVAIKYEKVYITDDLYAFKPVGLIKGNYDKGLNVFETNYADLCISITSSDYGELNYFGFPIEIKELKEQSDDLEEFYLLNKYFVEKSEQFCIGYYNVDNGCTNVLTLSYEDVCNIYDAGMRNLILETGNTQNEVTEEAQYEDDEYEDDFSGVKNEKAREMLKISVDKKQKKPLTLVELRKEVKSVIIGQDKAVDDVTRTIMINEKSNNPKNKSHMMIVGPSGTGKTEMINIIAKKLNIPFFKADATAYTKEGYVGKSVYSMFNGLIDAANGDVEKAQRGLLIIDEIDKKLSTEKRDDVSGVDVLNSMLKFLDRDTIEVDRGRGHSEEQILFDTSNLTVIFMGAFSDAYKDKQTSNKKFIGFAAAPEEKEVLDDTYLTKEDLIKAGMPAEFMGRISLVTNTRSLELEDLVEILYKSKGGALELAKEFCKDLGITLKYTDGYIRKIAEKSYKTKTGARNLKSLVNESLKDAYDDVLINNENIKTLKLTKKTAENSKEYCVE